MLHTLIRRNSDYYALEVYFWRNDKEQIVIQKEKIANEGSYEYFFRQHDVEWMKFGCIGPRYINSLVLIQR